MTKSAMLVKVLTEAKIILDEAIPSCGGSSTIRAIGAGPDEQLRAEAFVFVAREMLEDAASGLGAPK